MMRVLRDYLSQDSMSGTGLHSDEMSPPDAPEPAPSPPSGQGLGRDPERSAVVEPCVIDESSDYVCVRGTVGCDVDHDALARDRPLTQLAIAEHELAQAERDLKVQQDLRYSLGSTGPSPPHDSAIARVNSAAARLMAAAARATLARHA